MRDAILDTALATYKDWQCEPQSGKPMIERAIQLGLSNRSFLVRWEQERFVLRLFAEQSVHFAGVEAELLISHQAFQANIAPRQLYISREHRFTVSEFINGVHWTVKQACLPDNVRRLAASLKQIHQLPGSHRELVLSEVMARYQQQLAGTPFEKNITRRQQRMLSDNATELRDSLESPVLCHNDLVLDNLIDNGKRLYIIDWEYAALCDPIYDIAVIVLNHQLGKGQTELLLASYYGQKQGHYAARFKRMYPVAAYIDYLWYAVQSLVVQPSRYAGRVQAKLEYLLQLLN